MTEDTRDIYQRIDAARQHFPAILKTAKGQVGSQKYKYADLDDVVDGVEGPLRDEGVGIFPTVLTECVVTVLRILGTHADGDATAVRCAIPLPEGLTPQQVGSACTYYRRYALNLLLNLRAADDDGAAATRPEIADGKQGTTGTPAASLPDGWFSQGDCTQAHNDLAAHIKTLSESKQAEARLFREQNGWPVSADLLNALKLALGA